MVVSGRHGDSESSSSSESEDERRRGRKPRDGGGGGGGGGGGDRDSDVGRAAATDSRVSCRDETRDRDRDRDRDRRKPTGSSDESEGRRNGRRHQPRRRRRNHADEDGAERRRRRDSDEEKEGRNPKKSSEDEGFERRRGRKKRDSSDDGSDDEPEGRGKGRNHHHHRRRHDDGDGAERRRRSDDRERRRRDSEEEVERKPDGKKFSRDEECGKEQKLDGRVSDREEGELVETEGEGRFSRGDDRKEDQSKKRERERISEGGRRSNNDDSSPLRRDRKGEERRHRGSDRYHRQNDSDESPRREKHRVKGQSGGRRDCDDSDRSPASRGDSLRREKPRENGRKGKCDDGDPSPQGREKNRDYKDDTDKEDVGVQQMLDAARLKSEGIYIPPHRMVQILKEMKDKSSEEYQRLTWDALKKSINGLVNKVNATNIKNIIPELLSENLVRGRGLFCRSCLKSQMASPGFTDVFAALVAVVNTKFPEVGLLLLKRIVVRLKLAYKRNDKPQLLATTKFIAHLVNQQVAHEIVALELLTVLLENPTDDSVEVAVGFVKECGALLQDLSPQALHGIFERFRGILHEGEIDKRVQFLIEGLFAIRKAKFQGFPAIRPELDLVEQEDQFTHEISLEEEINQETQLDVFKPNPQFLEDEKAYENLKRSILGDESSDDEGSDAASDDEDEEESEEDEEENMQIKDETETNLVNLRRTIYLTIMSSVDFEEAGHKLLKIKLEPGQEMELCIMLLECCSQERTYLRYYGLLGQRFCLINKVYQENFEKCFVQQYSMIHRLETNKLRNVAKFFAHLLGTNALPWHVLAYIRLTEEDTTSSSRIFIKILFQELSEHLGIRLLNERLNDPTMQDSFESIFPKDNPKNTRFSINFFTSIGLGGITESLREYLKNMPRIIMQQQKPVSESDDESGSSSASSSSGSSSESDSSESDSDSSSDDSGKNKRHRKRRKRN